MEPRSIIVKATNWVGDTVLTTPALGTLRKNFPSARITVLARPWVSPLLEHHPCVDELWSHDEKQGVGEYLKVVRRIRSRRFDLGISFPNSFSAAFLLWAGVVKRRIGHQTYHRGAFLSDAIEVSSAILRAHQVHYYLHILKNLCDVEQTEATLFLFVTDEERASIRERLKQEGIGESDMLVLLNPGARYGSAKRWDPERYAEVADYLTERHGAHVVAIGSKYDSPIVEEVQSAGKHDLIHYAGNTTLRELMALIERANLLVTNDSGAMHIAAAFNVPLVAIFGSTDWRTTYPFSENAVVVRKDTACAPCLLRECPEDHECMKKIEVKDVIEALETLLAKKTSREAVHLRK